MSVLIGMKTHKVRGVRQLRCEFSALPFDPSELPQILKRLSAFASNEINLGESP